MPYPVLVIPGIPRTEGSLKPMTAHEHLCNICGRWHGRIYNIPQQDKALTMWRGSLASAIRGAWGEPQLDRPSFLVADFWLPPPSRDHHDKDVDKLLRAVLDALKMGGAVRDDRHIALCLGVKEYIGAAHTAPGARLEFGLMGDLTDAITALASRHSDPQWRVSYAGQPPKHPARTRATTRLSAADLRRARPAPFRTIQPD